MESETVKRIEINGAPGWAIQFGDAIVIQRSQAFTASEDPLRDQEKLTIILCEQVDALAAQVRELREENERLRINVKPIEDEIHRLCAAAGVIADENARLNEAIATAREEAIRACESERLSLHKIGAVHEDDKAYENAITDCQNAIRALKLRHSAPPTGSEGWKPIESAPKDGTPIQGCWFVRGMNEWIQCTVIWHPGGGWAQSLDPHKKSTQCGPTLWRHLFPSPPKPAQEER